MRAALIVDDVVRMDDDLNEWHRRPPAEMAALVQPGAKPEPYLVAAGWFLGEATRRGQSVRVTVNTRDHGLNIDVEYGRNGDGA